MSWFADAIALDYKKINVEIPAPGREIDATLYSLDGKSGPAVLLVNSFFGSGSDWEPYLSLLKKAKITSILTVDFKFDLQPNNMKTENANLKSTDEGVTGILEDLTAAWQFLKNNPSTDTTRMGIMGALAGANYAALFAAKTKDVKSLVMLSPGIVYRGVECGKAIAEYGERAVFFAASAEDHYSVNSCKNLHGLSKGAPAHVEIYDGNTRGCDLIKTGEKFTHFLSDWFLSTL